jgi:hypothetical protein
MTGCDGAGRPILFARHRGEWQMTDQKVAEQTNVLVNRIAIAETWVSEYTTQPHPELGRGGVVCPYMVKALRRDLVQYMGFDANEGDKSLIMLARWARDGMDEQEDKLGPDAIYPVSLILPHGLPEDEIKAMIKRVQALHKPEFVRLGYMLGDFWPDHEMEGLHNPAFSPFSSPVPMLGVRRIVPADLVFFITPELCPDDKLKYLGFYRNLFAGRLNDYWAERLADAVTAATLESGQDPLEV